MTIASQNLGLLCPPKLNEKSETEFGRNKKVAFILSHQRGELGRLMPEDSSLHEQSAAAAKSVQSCPILCDPIDGGLPGSSVHGIFQARVLEWGAVSSLGAYIRQGLAVRNQQ